MSSKLPSNWGLKTKKRSDGKLDIVGQTDAGEKYVVRTTDGPEVTDRDLAELKAADRESYSSRSEGARAFVSSLLSESEQRQQGRDEAFGDEMVEASGPVSFALLDRKGHSSPFTGSTHAFRKGWEIAFGKDN